MKPLVTMRAALGDPDLFGAIFAGPSWDGWRVLLIAIVGEELTTDERIVFEGLTGREREPGERVDEAWCCIGRRSGKTRAMAVLAAYIAALCDHSAALAPGERAVLPIMSASVWQSGKAFQYLEGIFSGVRALAALVMNKTSDTISLVNSVDVECRPASFRTIRGVTAIAIIADEVAYWRNENSANPDKEILDAVRPAPATTNGLIVCISSPYARRGELWNAYKRDFGQAGDPRILIAKAASRTLNPTLSERIVERAFERDPVAASAEYGAEFRNDVEAFVSIEAVEACVAEGVFERAPIAGVVYFAFVDPSGGSSDSMTLAVAHDEDGVATLDAIREVKPPFSPEAVVREFVDVLKLYRVGTVSGDRYAGEWPRERFSEHGISYLPSEKSKSEIYGALLPLINSGKAALLDDKRLVTQLIGLERRTARGGRDSIDHAPAAHDDRANAAAGALWLVTVSSGMSFEQWARVFAGTDAPATAPDVPAALPWHKSSKEREAPAAEATDLMQIYREAFAKTSAGFPVERSKICARCGAAIGASRITDFVNSWCVGCK